MKDMIVQIIQEMFVKDTIEWETRVKGGKVIPLIKKGDRANRYSYRGVCLLSICSRILARVMAARIQDWAEETDILGDLQHGFRQGRSTADATQVMIRIQEEMVEEMKDRQWNNTQDVNQAKAILLDIRKA